jgi:uncharacterized protein (DUF885 family)
MIALLLSLALADPSSASSALASPSHALAALFDAEWERWMIDDPVWASSLGDRRFNDKWSDMSLTAIDARSAKDAAALAALNAIPTAPLNDAERLNADVFRDVLEQRLGAHRHRLHLLALDQMGGVHSQEQLIDSLRFETQKDYEDWLARMQAFPALVDQHIALLRAGMAAKWTQPKIAVSRVPAQIAAQVVDDPSKSSLYAPFKKITSTSIGEGARKKLEERAKATVRDRVVPAMKKLHDFVVNEYLPACSDDIAMSSRSGGKEAYAFLVKMHTTTSRTPEEIHALGLKEVERIRREMDKTKSAMGFKGTLAELFVHMRTEPRFFYATGDEILTGTRALTKKIDGRLVKVLKTMPRTPYGVEPVPDAIAPDVTTAYYSGPAADGSRGGTYFVNTYKPEARPRWEMVPLALHEAAPGHHTQIALANELDKLPMFRRYAAPYTAFIEGWGLYAESLGADMGLYDDPADRMGQLTYEMWRAVRLVVDTGMHHKGWPRQRAIDYFLANAPKTPLDVTNEVDRYIVWPAQALAYKSGELKLQELRARAHKKLGAKFSLGAFHDAVLLEGPLPLGILEKRVDAWMSR